MKKTKSTRDPRLAPVMDRVWSSPTLRLHTLAEELKAAGKKAITLAVGESQFDIPSNIRRAMKKATDDWKQTRYTPVGGTLKTREAVAFKLKKENRLVFDPSSEIVISAGGKQAIYNALFATLSPGDEVIIPTPYWYSHAQITDTLEGKCVFIKGDPKSFKISAKDLEKAITPRTKWFILTSPSNPTGAVYSEKELKEIAAVLMRHSHVLVMSDDVYEYLILEKKPFKNLLMIEPKLRDRLVVINGAGKAFCMTGLRIGYAAGPSWLIAAMTKLQRGETLNPSSISQAGMVEALEGSRATIFKYNKIYRRWRDITLKELSKVSALRLNKPDAAFYVYVDVSSLIGKKTPRGNLIENDTDVGVYLLEHFLIAIAPGVSFGYSPYIRICYASVRTEKELREGLKRLVKGLQSLVGNR